MIRVDTPADVVALRNALLTLEQIGRRSTDKNSRALADGAAADLRACVEAWLLNAAEAAR